MKARYILLTVAALVSQAFAGTPTIEAPALDGNACKKAPKLGCKRLTGSLSAGYATNYTCRGLVASHALVEGDSVEKLGLDLSYDIGRKGFFTLENHTGYTIISSGHQMFGVPGYSFDNELTVETSLKYSLKRFSVSAGHQFTRGGLLGALAHNVHNQGASVVNEAFVALAYSPLKCLELGVKTSYAFDGLQGWWFEPYIRNTFTLVGCCKAPKLQSVVTVGLSATSGFFNENDANKNGAQAIWVSAELPWHVTKQLVLTPGVSFNWLGCGATNTGNAYRNQGVVGSLSASYIF